MTLLTFDETCHFPWELFLKPLMLKIFPFFIGQLKKKTIVLLLRIFCWWTLVGRGLLFHVIHATQACFSVAIYSRSSAFLLVEHSVRETICFTKAKDYQNIEKKVLFYWWVFPPSKLNVVQIRSIKSHFLILPMKWSCWCFYFEACALNWRNFLVAFPPTFNSTKLPL